MKKLTILLLSTLLLLLTACGSKIPFKKQEPLANSALVYVYLPSNISDDDSDFSSDYNIRFNGRRVMERISSDEYMAFNVKDSSYTRLENTVNHVFLADWNFSEFVISDVLTYCIFSVYGISD